MLQNIPSEYHEDARALRSLFERQLECMYSTESTMSNSLLSEIIAAASSKDLIAILQSHTVETLGQTARLEKIFRDIGIATKGKPDDALNCFIKEAEAFISHVKRGVVRDAGIISVLQKIKHYEIACYGTMRAYAIALREEDVVALLEQTLEEEKATDLALSAIAESHINIEAADKEI